MQAVAGFHRSSQGGGMGREAAQQLLALARCIGVIGAGRLLREVALRRLPQELGRLLLDTG